MARGVGEGRLFEGGDNFKYFHQRGRLFKGGDYSGTAIIRGNTVL